MAADVKDPKRFSHGVAVQLSRSSGTVTNTMKQVSPLGIECETLAKELKQRTHDGATEPSGMIAND